MLLHEKLLDGAGPDEVAMLPSEVVAMALPEGVTHSFPPAHALGKRCFDLVFGSLALLLLLPAFLIASIAIKLGSRGPVLFVQTRVGRDGELFQMYKFRTMVIDAEKQEEALAETLEGSTFFKIKNDDRITWVGRFHRKYSIDELPQLLNVLNGTMSLVGPRPLLRRDFDRFAEVTRELDLDRRYARFSVPPGMTGLWQVSGRSTLSDEERMRLDLDYVDRWGPLWDIWILLRTIPAVLTARGAT